MVHRILSYKKYILIRYVSYNYLLKRSDLISRSGNPKRIRRRLVLLWRHSNQLKKTQSQSIRARIKKRIILRSYLNEFGMGCFLSSLNKNTKNSQCDKARWWCCQDTIHSCRFNNHSKLILAVLNPFITRHERVWFCFRQHSPLRLL